MYFSHMFIQVSFSCEMFPTMHAGEVLFARMSHQVAPEVGLVVTLQVAEKARQAVRGHKLFQVI